MKIDCFSMKIYEKSWIFMISQCFLGNLGSMKSTPQSYVRSYRRPPLRSRSRAQRIPRSNGQQHNVFHCGTTSTANALPEMRYSEYSHVRSTRRRIRLSSSTLGSAASRSFSWSWDAVWISPYVYVQYSKTDGEHCEDTAGNAVP